METFFCAVRLQPVLKHFEAFIALVSFHQKSNKIHMLSPEDKCKGCITNYRKS